MKKLLLIALFACGAAFGSAAQTRFEKIALKEAVKRAAEEKKLVFVDLYASWCPPCRMMSERVFPQEQVGACMNEHFVAVKYDIERDADGRSLKARYGVRSIPAYFVFDGAGRLAASFGGGMTAEELLAKLREIVGKE